MDPLGTPDIILGYPGSLRAVYLLQPTALLHRQLYRTGQRQSKNAWLFL